MVPLAESTSSDYPEPRVPKNPVLGWGALGLSRAEKNDAYPEVLDLAHVKLVTSARFAIAIALRELGVGAGDEVLVPAFHCLSMIEPIVWSGANPRLYPLDDNLEIGLKDIAQTDMSRVKAMLVTHYFGFPQPMRAISAFCAERGIGLIEDCAHAMFGKADGKPIGSWGDFAAVSMMKFLPIYDGGGLVSDRRPLDGIELRTPSLRVQAKAVVNSLERSLHYHRFPGLYRPMRVVLGTKDYLWSAYKRLRNGNTPKSWQLNDPAASDGSSGFDPAWLDRSISLPSATLVSRLPRDRIILRRRANYQRLVEGLRGSRGARAMYPELPLEVVPYVMPLFVDRPQPIFDAAKRAGIPIFRWEEFWGGDVPRYAAGLFQIPCHQELTMAEIDWVIATLRNILDSTP